MSGSSSPVSTILELAMRGVGGGLQEFRGLTIMLDCFFVIFKGILFVSEGNLFLDGRRVCALL